MALVKVKEKFQLTIPTKERRYARIAIGDLMDVEAREDGELRFRAKRIVDRSIAEGLKDMREGRTCGPFSTAEDAIASLHTSARKKRR